MGRVANRLLHIFTALASVAPYPKAGGLHHLDAMVPAAARLAAARLMRDTGTLPPDGVFYLVARALLDLAAAVLQRDDDLAADDLRLEAAPADEWSRPWEQYQIEADARTVAVFRAQGEGAMADLYLRDRLTFDRRFELGREHFFGAPLGAHART